MSVLPLLPDEEFDYTQMERWDMLSRLQTLAHQANPYWKDFSTVHPENLLLECMTTQGSMLRGTMEERARQWFWGTVTERQSAIKLGRADNFKLSSGTAPTLDVVLTYPGGVVAPKDVRIPIKTTNIPYGLSIRTKDPTSIKLYHLDYNVHVEGSANVWKNPLTGELYLILSAGQLSITASFEGSSVYNPSYESNEQPNQELLLDSYPYISGSSVVTADGLPFVSLDDETFLGQSPDARVFIERIDSEGRGRLVFGNGINGKIPLGIISVVYRAGGGTDAEVEDAVEWSIDDAVYDVDGSDVQLVASNPSASSSATDSMTVDEARVLGPLFARTKSRSVIDDDFETVATSVAGIARAAMITSNHDAGMEEDTGVLLLIGRGEKLTSGRYAPASSITAAKIAEVTAKFAEDALYEQLMGFSVTVLAVDSNRFHDVGVSVKIYKSTGWTGVSVKTSITNALKDLFAVSMANFTPNSAIDFGSRLKDADGVVDHLLVWSDVFKSVLNAPGVRKIASASDNLLLNGAHTDIYIDPQDFPRLNTGSIAIYDMDNGGLLL